MPGNLKDISDILVQLKSIEHGFKHINDAGSLLLKEPGTHHFDLARQLIEDESYQGRMLGTYMLGVLSPENPAALSILKDTVSKDPNWRVQEMLAKAIDEYARITGYEEALPTLQSWLESDNPNVVRAVIEGLRIWTSRPFFKQHPEVAVYLISQHKADASEYVRKSVGNSLRDISKKFPDLINQETSGWDLSDRRISFTHKLVII
ncbi:hypothetical protein DYBT9275_03630 [Dyadobacter sp. CECT 9275]|uniref:HEAT repeat domain-containing protein n=1 Tax=Dyadobacter helix TaxID=2822344 RepID=A0A916JGK1_9BACT|nr:HEAT repeat domain-containing protein [Dyadobacter sp. CECT 9275]CAG5005690.1 hypothetical protein DYBT9275_03630 [Dyadobacter sp. CECT 9275]